MPWPTLYHEVAYLPAHTRKVNNFWRSPALLLIMADRAAAGMNRMQQPSTLTPAQGSQQNKAQGEKYRFRSTALEVP